MLFWGWWVGLGLSPFWILVGVFERREHTVDNLRG